MTISVSSGESSKCDTQNGWLLHVPAAQNAVAGGWSGGEGGEGVLWEACCHCCVLNAIALRRGQR